MARQRNGLIVGLDTVRDLERAIEPVRAAEAVLLRTLAVRYSSFTNENRLVHKLFSESIEHASQPLYVALVVALALVQLQVH